MEIDYDKAKTIPDDEKPMEISPQLARDFIANFKEMQEIAAHNARLKGWDVSNGPEQIALMHEELSEALRAMRTGNPPDKHCPQHDNLTVELADEIIRIATYSGTIGLDVGTAFVDKVSYNITRPHKHGNKAF